ncbi:hypothetical protein BT96DRAFT_1007092 [Gymnopus androsaceus JB14]|uniref:Crinkler effector protein N-terminal domain-containing protein n=1 Tax=Gymnopus androsaceus JB14 TaxID=1447944 RepID=A0A6A4GIH6_9AGAR|nr:hypothetical protein BT96DRAFT_1007092 [Gymnopus androsaceus JB14]
MTRELELNCLVLDSHASINRIFTVQILETDNVATLKEKIKEKKHTAFQHIDADALDLWNVSISIGDLSETHLHDLQPARAPLLPVKRLGRLYLDAPPEEHLHIIAKPPHIAASPDPQSLLELNCLTETVGSLKEAVKGKKHPLFNHVAADNLILWRVSEVVDQNFEKNLENANFREKESLSPVDKLSKIFPNLPVEGCLHIVVWCPEDENPEHGEQRDAI